jgi:hypothetical protein
MERVGESETRRRAWKRVKANRGAPGVEGMTLDAADTWVRMHGPTGRESRLQGPDHPRPRRRTAIPTPSGGARGLGIPAGIDRLIQPARRQGLTPIVDPECSASSFGVRPQRSAHGAVRPVHAVLRNGYRVARYADARLILVTSQRAVERVTASLTRDLTGIVRLSVNEQTSRVAPIHEGVYLGVTVRGTNLRWSDQAFADVRHRLTRLTGRRWGVAMDYRLGTLAQDLRGWMGDVGIADDDRPIPDLDHWRRRRVRMAYWTPWRHARTTVRHRLALGTTRRQAIVTAIRRTSDGHRSKTLATPSGMTNAWLHQPGRLSIRDRWMTAHGVA